MRVWIRERPQPVVVFLTCGIPQRQLDCSSVNVDLCDVVLKNCRDVELGEGALRASVEGSHRPTRL